MSAGLRLSLIVGGLFVVALVWRRVPEGREQRCPVCVRAVEGLERGGT